MQLVSGTEVSDLETSTDRLEQWVRDSSLVAGNSIRLVNVQRSGIVVVSRIFSFLGSSVVGNDLWVVSLNDGQSSTFSVTTNASDVSATDPKASLVARIASEINKDANLDQTVDGTYLAFADGPRLQIVRRVDGRSFSINVAMTRASQTFNQIDLRSIPLNAGDLWTLGFSSGGVVTNYAVTATNSDVAQKQSKSSIRGDTRFVDQRWWNLLSDCKRCDAHCSQPG